MYNYLRSAPFILLFEEVSSTDIVLQRLHEVQQSVARQT